MKNKVKLNTDREWLLHLAENDNNRSMSVGGLAAKLGLVGECSPVGSATVTAFAKLIELRRREKGLTVEKLAEKADIDLADLISIESAVGSLVEPRTVYKLAQVLGLPTQRLMQLSGLTEPKDPAFQEAAVRFAARSKPADQLTKEEHQALAELVKIMSEGSHEHEK